MIIFLDQYSLFPPRYENANIKKTNKNNNKTPGRKRFRPRAEQKLVRARHQVVCEQTAQAEIPLGSHNVLGYICGKLKPLNYM